MREILKIAVTLVVVAALAMTGIALAQSSDSTVTDLAPDGDRLQASILERLAPLVEDGTLTGDQAAAVAEHLAGTIDFPRRGFTALREAIAFLGITSDELRAALSEGTTLAELAEANGSSGEELVAHLVGQVESHLDDAVADGRITEEERAERLATAEERIAALVAGELDMRPHDRPRRPRFAAIREALDFLGITTGELREALSEGMTLADLAEANGSNGDELVAHLLELVEAHLDEAVADGRITEVEKAEMLENAEEHLAALVNGEIDGPGFHRRPSHRGPRFGPFGDAPPFERGQ